MLQNVYSAQTFLQPAETLFYDFELDISYNSENVDFIGLL